MHEIDLRRLDLNLLVVLDELLKQRSVSRTAARIGRTQSATSHALARLREQLDDPLLVRVGDGMQPTPRAEALREPLARTLRVLARVLGERPQFEAESSTRVFTLAGPDFLAAQVPELLAALRERVPHARLELRGPGPRMFTELVDAQLDLVLAPPPTRSIPGVHSESLAELDWVVFARRGHPRTRRWGLRAWLRCEHIQIRTRAAQGPVDAATQAAGHDRQVSAWLPSFQAAAPLVAGSDLILTAPAQVLGSLVERYELQVLRCPIELAPIPLALHFAASLARDEALGLFRAAVGEALG